MKILWIEDKCKDEKLDWFGQYHNLVEYCSDFTKAWNKISDSLDCYDLIILDINLEDSE